MVRRWGPAAVIAVAFMIRTIGIGYGLPHVYHQDEPMMVNHALAIGTGDWNTHYFVIPPFVSYTLFLFYGAYYLVGRLLGAFGCAEHFAAVFLSDPTAFYLLGRFVIGVLLGTATVAALYRLGKRHFSRSAGLAAAMFLALAPIHVQHSHYIYADVPVTLAVVLLFDALLALGDRPSWRRYAALGLLLGWGTAAKYTAAYFVPVIVLAHLAAHGRRSAAPAAFFKLVFAGVLSLATFGLIAPYTFIDWKNFIATMKLQSAGESFVGWTHHLVYSIGNGVGPLLLVLIVLGVIGAFATRDRKARLIVAGVAWFYLVNTVFSQHYARYILPVIPLLSLLAAAGWERIGKKAAILWLVGASLALPSLYLDAMYLKTDTRTLCFEWFEKNAPGASIIAADNRFFAPPLPRDPGSFAGVRDTLEEEGLDRARRLRLELLGRAAQNKKTYAVHVLVPGGDAPRDPEFALSGPFVDADEASLERIGADFVVFNFTDYNPVVHELRGRLAGRWALVARFSPYRSGERLSPRDPHATTAGPHLLPELFGRSRLGPVIEVWRKKA